MPTQIDFSGIESDILGLKCGRCNSDNFDEKILYQQITDGNYDLCRLKVPAEDEMSSVRLNKMGLPFFFSGSIRRYKTGIKEAPPGKYNYTDLAFEIYDGSQDVLLKKMLAGTWGAYPIGYYRSPYLGGIVTKERELESVFQYYKKHNLNKDYPDNSILFIRHGDLYVGFFALNIVNGNLESHIGGILEPYRKANYFLDMLRYIKEYCVKQRLEHFIFGARNENAEVQRIFQYVGFNAIGSENVFHIPSLLEFSVIPARIKDVALQPGNLHSLYQLFLDELKSVAGGDIARLGKISYQVNNIHLLPGELSAKMRISFPVMNETEMLMVVKGTGNVASPVTAYLRVFEG